MIISKNNETHCFVFISRASKQTFWYKNLVGRMANVIDDGTGYLYETNPQTGAKKYIQYGDAILLEHE